MPATAHGANKPDDLDHDERLVAMSSDPPLKSRYHGAGPAKSYGEHGTIKATPILDAVQHAGQFGIGNTRTGPQLLADWRSAGHQDPIPALPPWSGRCETRRLPSAAADPVAESTTEPYLVAPVIPCCIPT
jgi:hypothetical protein